VRWQPPEKCGHGAVCPLWIKLVPAIATNHKLVTRVPIPVINSLWGLYYSSAVPPLILYLWDSSTIRTHLVKYASLHVLETEVQSPKVMQVNPAAEPCPEPVAASPVLFLIHRMCSLGTHLLWSLWAWFEAGRRGEENGGEEVVFLWPLSILCHRLHFRH
jgi:hypothetical protein